MNKPIERKPIEYFKADIEETLDALGTIPFDYWKNLPEAVMDGCSVQVYFDGNAVYKRWNSIGTINEDLLYEGVPIARATRGGGVMWFDAADKLTEEQTSVISDRLSSFAFEHNLMYKKEKGF